MRVEAVRGKLLVLAGASAMLVISVPAATGASFPGTSTSKTCAQINGCSAVVATPPRVEGGAPGAPAPPPSPSSRFGITVATAPAATVGGQSQSGQLLTKVDQGRGIRCRGYAPRDSTTFVFNS